MSERPVCENCDHPVAGNHYYNINGDVICKQCMEECFREEIFDDEYQD